jgi:hypothetical protein
MQIDIYEFDIYFFANLALERVGRLFAAAQKSAGQPPCGERPQHMIEQQYLISIVRNHGGN